MSVELNTIYELFRKKYPYPTICPNRSLTCGFGYVERYRYIDGKQIWGYPGIHKGLDFGKGDGDRSLFTPFNFNRSRYKEEWKDGELYGYGTNVYMYQDVLQFRLKYCHMWPNEIEIREELENRKPLDADVYIGPQGSAGNSTGRHLHLEVESWDPQDNVVESMFLEYILDVQYGKDAHKNLSEEYIIEITKNFDKVKKEKWSDKKILDEYESLLSKYKITFLNTFKMEINKNTTLYNVNALWNV